MAVKKGGLPPGTLVHNRYKILQVLGTGGFGVTYKVHDLKENTISAMKEYMPNDISYRVPGSNQIRPIKEADRAMYVKFYQQFYKEAQCIYSLRGHPNIVEVKHLFQENNTVYYVMAYVDGMDLKTLIQQRGSTFRWEELRPMMHQVATGLMKVHATGIIHCDISPDNIFLMNNGRIILLDFGAAKSTLRGSVETSVIVEKSGFAPYEQIRGKNMNTWTDVHALAVTIYYCLTGRLVPDVRDRIVNDKIRMPSQMGIAVPSAAWEQALRKGMALKVEDRYATVTEFWAALNGANPRIQPNPQPNPTPQGRAELRGIQGVFANRSIPVTQEIRMGVDPGRCNLVFPLGTPGISRLHLRVWADREGILVMDMGSTYGTFINRAKLTPGNVYRLAPGSILLMGGGETFRAT